MNNQPEKSTLLGLQGKQFPLKEVPACPTLLIRVDLGTSGVPVHTCHCWWLSIISFLFFQASAALNERLGLSATLSQTQNILVNNQLSWLYVASCNTTRLREGLGKFDSELNSQREKSAFPPRPGTRLNYYTEQNSSSLLPKGCSLPGHQGNFLVPTNICLEGSER